MSGEIASAAWLAKAIDDGLTEWADARIAEHLPPLDEREKEVYRLGFTAGADATLQHVSEVLKRPETAPDGTPVTYCECCDLFLTDGTRCIDCEDHVDGHCPIR